MANKMNLPIDEYNRQFNERVLAFNALTDNIEMLLEPSTCKQCGRLYVAICECNEAGKKALWAGIKLIKGIEMSLISFQSERLAKMSDVELDAQHDYFMSIYHNADNSEQGVHKANQANWYATLCLNEKIKRRTNSNPK